MRCARGQSICSAQPNEAAEVVHGSRVMTNGVNTRAEGAHELVSKPRRRRRIVIVLVLDIGVMSVKSDVAMMICKPADSTMPDARCTMTMPATIDDRDRVNVARQ